jgi:putative phosphoesterase
VRVGVISDTHDSIKIMESLIEKMLSEGVEAIIHLGDFIAPFTLKKLASHGVKVIAVFGNNDGEKQGLMEAAREANVDLSEGPREIELGGRKLLLLHGYGSKEFTKKIVYALAASRRWDAVLYGHTHEYDITYYTGVLVLNPGDGGGVLNSPTAAILDLRGLRARVVTIEG